jgi:hypothetical protein
MTTATQTAATTFPVGLTERDRAIFNALEGQLDQPRADAHFDVLKLALDCPQAGRSDYTVLAYVPKGDADELAALAWVEELSSATEDYYLWLPQISESADESVEAAIDLVVHSVQAGFEPGAGWLLERLIIPAYATGSKAIHLLALVQLKG